MNTLSAIVNVLTEMDSAMLTLAFGGLLGLGALRVIGIWVKPNYYTKGSHADS